MLPGHGAYRLAVAQLVVRRPQGGGVPDAQLLLAMAELRIVLLDDEALGGERVDHLGDDRRGGEHPDRTKAESLIVWPILVALAARQRPLGLEGGLDGEPGVARLGDRALQEAAWAGAPGRPVEGAEIDED